MARQPRKSRKGKRVHEDKFAHKGAKAQAKLQNLNERWGRKAASVTDQPPPTEETPDQEGEFW